MAGANLAWGLVLAALLWRRASWRRAWKSPLLAPLAAYCAIALFTGLLGVDPANSLRHFNQDLHKLWLCLLLTAALAAEPEAPLAPALGLGLAAAACVGVFQSLSSFSSGGAPWDWQRAHAFVHPTTFGIQMLTACLGALCFLSDRRLKARKPVWALLALCSAALFLSNTRGALLGLAAGAAALPLALPRLRRPALIGLAAAGLCLLAMEVVRPDRSLIAELSGLWTPSYGEHSGQKMRLTLWKAALEMGADHPLTGVGPNNYPRVFPAYFSGLLDGKARTWGTAHNLYLHQFAERGLLGLGVLLWLLWTMLSKALERARRDPGPWNLWALSAVAAFLAVNMTEVAFQTEVLWMLVFLICLTAEARSRARGHA